MNTNITPILKTAFVVSALSLVTACGGGSSSAASPAPSLTPAPAPAPAPAPQPTDFQAKLDEMVSDTMPGAVLFIDSPSESFIGSAGVTDLRTLEPMSIDAVMPTGSAGKSMTAVLALQLVEEGRLSLDAPISDYLPDEIIQRIDRAESATMRTLLNHTSGIFEYLHNDAFTDALMQQPEKVRLDADVAAFAYDQPSSYEEGDGFDYSNTNYVLAGMVLDSVLGYHHSIAIRERILTPLGMDATFYIGAEQGDVISGYNTFAELEISDDTSLVNLKPYLSNLGLADAPVASTVEDYARYWRGLVSDTQLLSEESRALLLGEQDSVAIGGNILVDDSALAHGLGLFVERWNGHTVYHHGGDQFGWRTFSYHWPQRDTTIMLMTNCATQHCEQQAQALIDTVFRDRY